MKIRKGELYLSDLASATYKQRLFYVAANYLRPDWSVLAPNINPLDWCLRDIGKLVYLVVLFVLIYPVLLAPCALYEAHRVKARYAGDKWAGVRQTRAYWLEV